MTGINHAELGNVQILTARDTDSTYGSEERGFYLVGFIAGLSVSTYLAWVIILNDEFSLWVHSRGELCVQLISVVS